MIEFLLLGQAEAGDAAPGTEQTQSSTKVPAPGDEVPGGEQAPKTKGLTDMLLPLMLMLMVMYFFVFRGPKKKQQKQKQMLAEMKKNDRVRTIGGIIGTVVDLRDNEVVIKIDESNNTKMKLVRNAINVVLTDEGEEKK